MATVKLAVSSREGSGKGPARRLRSDGRIPAILYGAGISDSSSISIDRRELRAALSTSAGARVVLDLQMEGGSGQTVALLKDLQRHPVSGDPLHADLLAIRLDQPVDVEVPIVPVGTSPGVKLEGGTLEWARRQLSIRVLPTAIPESIDLDLSELHIGGSIHVSDLKVEGAEIVDDAELTICSVKSTRIEVEDSDAEAEDGEAADAAAPAEGGDAPADGDA